MASPDGSGSGARRTSRKATGAGGAQVASRPDIRYPGISPKSWEHPADRAATAALHAIPGLEGVVQKLIELGYERALRQSYLSSAVLVGPDQLPALHDDWREIRARLDVSGDLAFHVAQGADIQAMVIGAKSPYLVMTSRAVEVLDPAERLAVLGHEAGHVLSGHTTFRTALQILLIIGSRAGLVPLAGLPLTAVRLSLLEWYRATELSCDRAAAVAVRDPELVVRTLMTMAAGLPSSGLSSAAFMAQVRAYEEWDDGPDRLRRFLGNVNRTHSAPVRRAAELLNGLARVTTSGSCSASTSCAAKSPRAGRPQATRLATTPTGSASSSKKRVPVSARSAAKSLGGCAEPVVIATATGPTPEGVVEALERSRTRQI